MLKEVYKLIKEALIINKNCKTYNDKIKLEEIYNNLLLIFKDLPKDDLSRLYKEISDKREECLIESIGGFPCSEEESQKVNVYTVVISLVSKAIYAENNEFYR